MVWSHARCTYTDVHYSIHYVAGGTVSKLNGEIRISVE